MNSLALSNFKAIQLSPLEAFILVLKGKRDGKLGFPRQDEKAGWFSPQCGKETKAYYEFTAKKWAQTEKRNFKLHREITAMEQNIDNKQKQLDQLAVECPPVPDLSFAYPGEKGIDPVILQNRRQGEYARANKRYFSKCDELRTYIEQAQEKVSDYKATIAECENVTRLLCKRAKYRSEQRLSTYWHGLLLLRKNNTC